MLDLQVLFLTLIPVFSGIVPQDGLTSALPGPLFGISEPLTKAFLTGTWKTSEEFFKWGITDRERSTVRPVRKPGYVSFSKDGTLKMANLFNPAEGRWELRETELVLTDPRYPQSTERLISVRKRDNDRIWLLLPFSGGAIGVGMERVADDEFLAVEHAAKKTLKKSAHERQGAAARRSDATILDSSDTQTGKEEESADKGDRESEFRLWPH